MKKKRIRDLNQKLETIILFDIILIGIIMPLSGILHTEKQIQMNTFEISSSTPINDPIDYLIITIDEYYDILQNLANCKSQKGLTTEIITITDIKTYYPSGADLAEQMKNCIFDYYTNFNTQWGYVIGSRFALTLNFIYYSTLLLQLYNLFKKKTIDFMLHLVE
jgi:hypothetical protein